MSKASSRAAFENGDRRLDLAARAAWLSYEKHRTQDQIAKEMQVSRQVVQRLMALAHRSGLIEFRLNYELTECFDLAARLMEQFGLSYCEVAPNEQGSVEDLAAVGALGAQYLETVLPASEPFILGIGNGKTMRELSRRMERRKLPLGRCVSLMGNLTRDGKARNHDVVTWIADSLGAECYPRPMPIVTNTAEERAVLQAQSGYRSISALVEQAQLLVMGMGFFGETSSLQEDGFITKEEARKAIEAGAVAEFLGFAIDADGEVVAAEYHDRLTSYLPTPAQDRPVVVVASGERRVAALRAVFAQARANGLITDENTARLLFGDPI